jgi:predicted metal-dependent hydrolase
MQTVRTIHLGAREQRYTLRKRRGHKKLTLSVRTDGTITLTVPWWVSIVAAEQYLHDKEEWLLKAVERVPAHAGASMEERVNRYQEHKEAARTLIEARLVDLNSHYGFAWGRVAIRKNASSWGSCSSKHNLNFDYRILFLPPHLQDYIIVHELCHLREMNHSPRFWALVSLVVPEYAKYRRELRAVRRY